MELPNDVQVCFLLCIIVGMYHNADGYAADRTSFHQCALPMLCYKCIIIPIEPLVRTYTYVHELLLTCKCYTSVCILFLWSHP